jgi:cytidylate kinase
MTTIITLTGDLGSGKSTLSRLLIEELNYSYIYTGAIQRRIAKRLNMTTTQLNIYSETHPEIDEEIDNTFCSLGNTGSLIVDSRMAWFFIPHSFKVYLQVDAQVAARRIMGDSERGSEKYASIEDAVEKITLRKQSENRRYLQLYNADCSDMSNYNLVVDTSHLLPGEVLKTVLDAYNHWLKGGENQLSTIL